MAFQGSGVVAKEGRKKKKKKRGSPNARGVQHIKEKKKPTGPRKRNGEGRDSKKKRKAVYLTKIPKMRKLTVLLNNFMDLLTRRGKT